MKNWKFVAGLVIGLLIGQTVVAQESISTLPSFDVAAVRPGSHPVTPEGYSWSDVNLAGPGRFRAVNASLAECIEWAYGVRTDRISGPDWIKSNASTFDIDATAPVETTKEQARLMLRRLLAERFAVTLHSETKNVPGYELFVSKGGPKLPGSSAATSASPLSIGSSSTLHMTSAGVSMKQFVSALSSNLGESVVDKTNVTGLFRLDIRFARLNAADSDAESLFAVLQGLGLRLEAAGMPVELIQVDRANANPTPN